MNIVQGIRTRILEINALTQHPESFPTRKITNFVQKMIQTFDSGHKVAFVGNGGSAAEALHIAAEFTGKCVVEHRPVSAICLNSNQSELTAITNDWGVDQMFARLVEAHLIPGDVLVCLSTSGNSPNIIQALKVANANAIETYLWTGSRFDSETDAEVWKVPSHSTPRVQEIHLMWGHMIAELFETALNQNSSQGVK